MDAKDAGLRGLVADLPALPILIDLPAAAAVPIVPPGSALACLARPAPLLFCRPPAIDLPMTELPPANWRTGTAYGAAIGLAIGLAHVAMIALPEAEEIVIWRNYILAGAAVGAIAGFLLGRRIASRRQTQLSANADRAARVAAEDDAEN